MIVTTADTIPNKSYTIIDTILGEGSNYSLSNARSTAIVNLRNLAEEMEASAIIGFRLTMTFQTDMKQIKIIAYGTAVKFDS